MSFSVIIRVLIVAALATTHSAALHMNENPSSKCTTYYSTVPKVVEDYINAMGVVCRIESATCRRWDQTPLHWRYKDGNIS